MSRRPILGSRLPHARFDGTPPRVRTRSLWCWRAHDGLLLPLNEGMSVEYLGRTEPATISDSHGTSGALVAAEPAFSSTDWNGDGVREEDTLILSDEEALRYLDASTERLVWTMRAKTLRIDGVELGNALSEDAPYWSFTTDAVAGAYLALLGSGAGQIVFEHYNGTSSVTSALPVATGDRFSARACFHDDGRVQLGLVRNGATEVLGALSDALEPASEWGNGGATVCRVNEIGAASRGTLALRYGAVFGGVVPRATLVELL